jgi:hypothetical protein
LLIVAIYIDFLYIVSPSICKSYALNFVIYSFAKVTERAAQQLVHQNKQKLIAQMREKSKQIDDKYNQMIKKELGKIKKETAKTVNAKAQDLAKKEVAKKMEEHENKVL